MPIVPAFLARDVETRQGSLVVWPATDSEDLCFRLYVSKIDGSDLWDCLYVAVDLDVWLSYDHPVDECTNLDRDLILP